MNSWILIDLHVPLKEEARKKKGKWLSRATIKKMKERHKAWKTYRQFPSEKNFETYRSIRNVVNSLVRKDEDNHRKMMLQSFKAKQSVFMDTCEASKQSKKTSQL